MYRGKCIHGTKDVGTIKQRVRSPSPHCDTLHLKKTREVVTYFHHVSRSSLLATGSVQLLYLAYVTAFSKITHVIFSIILELFPLRKCKHRFVCVRIYSTKTTGSDHWFFRLIWYSIFTGNRSKNKLVRENSIVWAQGLLSPDYGLLSLPILKLCFRLIQWLTR